MCYFCSKYLFYIDIFKAQQDRLGLNSDRKFSILDYFGFSINKVIHRFVFCLLKALKIKDLSIVSNKLSRFKA